MNLYSRPDKKRTQIEVPVDLSWCCKSTLAFLFILVLHVMKDN